MINDPILAVAVRAARRAGSIIIDAARDLKRLAAHAKEHGGIASTARADAEKAIIATLRAAFPGHTIIGDEIVEAPVYATRGAGSAYRWIIDPIDGRTNFVHGFPYHAVSIALTDGRDITHAVVHDPIHDELFMAIRGKGAQLNGRRSASRCARHSSTRSWGRFFPHPQVPGCRPTSGYSAT